MDRRDVEPEAAGDKRLEASNSPGPPAVVGPAAAPPTQLAAAMGNAAFSRAVTGGFGLPAGGGARGVPLSRAVAMRGGDSAGPGWSGLPMPGTDQRLAARLERALALPGGSVARWRGDEQPGPVLARTPGRCACGGVAGPDGECEKCRSRRLAEGAGPTQAVTGRTVAREIQPDDPRLEDPGFLICTAFCYLGIPPSMFKTIIAGMLEAAYEHFRAENPRDYRQRFQVYQRELGVYSKVRLLGKAFKFLMTGELMLGLMLSGATAGAVRERVLAQLVKAGFKIGGLMAAEQIVRKISLYIDLAIAAGCGLYCTAESMARASIELADAAATGLVEALQTIEAIGRGIGEAVGGAISDVLASAYGQLDSGNWQLTGLVSGQARADLQALGLSLFAQIRPGGAWRARRPDQSEADAFVANAMKPISSFTTPYVQQTLLPSIANALHTAGAGASLGQQVTGTRLASMSPVGLVSLLRDEGFLEFRQDPIAYATAAMAESQQTAGAAAQ